MAPLQKARSGFTLIELLVVIAVIGILGGALIAFINPTRQLANARNAQRKKDLKDIANALESYAIDNGHYPSSSGNWCNTSATGTYSCAGNNPLSVLVPVYLKKLPIDPKNLTVNAFNASCVSSGSSYGYLYRSTGGNDYKILAYCSPEVTTVSATDPFKDPSRTTTSWSVYSPTGSAY